MSDEDNDRLEVRNQEPETKKKTEEGPKKEEDQNDSKTHSRGVYTTTYEEVIKKSVNSDSESESQDSPSASTEEEQQEQSKDSYELRVKEYINEISKGHEKYDKKERMLRNIPPKVPREWMFEKIHYKQKEAWETAATLKGWLIEQIRKERVDPRKAEDWLFTINRILTDFFEFETTEGLKAPTDELYQQIWKYYHNNKDPLDKIGDHYD